VLDPWIYSPDLQVGPGPPRVRTGTLEWDPDPPPPDGVRTAHRGVPRPYLRPRRGSGADTCPDCSGVLRTYPHTLLLPAQAEPRCCHVAYCTRHKPTGGTWRAASRLRAPSLQIRNVPVHSADRRCDQPTIPGPCSYSPLLVRFDYQCCMDCGHQDSR
jgi:hypothetical protein